MTRPNDITLRPFILYAPPEGGHRVEFIDGCYEGRVFDSWFGNNYFDALMCSEGLSNLERMTNPSTTCGAEGYICAASTSRKLYYYPEIFSRRTFFSTPYVVVKAKKSSDQIKKIVEPLPEEKKPIKCNENVDVRCS